MSEAKPTLQYASLFTSLFRPQVSLLTSPGFPVHFLG